MFCPSNEPISFVEITSYLNNPNHILHLCTDVALQSIITLTANFLSLKFLMNFFFFFFGLSTSSYLCFL